MGKITKKATEKHKVSLSPALVDFIQKTSTLPLAELRSHLSSLPTRWPFPRGDLYNWIEPLDRFDGILQKFNEKYGLNKGPQTQDFGTSLLQEESPGYDANKIEALGFGHDGDRVLIENILSFSRLLLEKCGNRALYNSSDRLNDLLNTTSLSLLHSALRITVFLALRYSERAPNTAQQQHSQFYSYDHERLNKIASPFVPLSVSPPKRILSTPARTKGKEKGPQPGKLRRSSTSVNPNDFKQLTRTGSREHGSGPNQPPQSSLEQQWHQWASVKVSWTPLLTETAVSESQLTQTSLPDPPTTPTPVRRQSSMLSRTPTSSSAMETSTTPNNAAAVATVTPSEKPGLQKIELSAADLSKTSIEAVLRDAPQDMPQPVRYELLHKLRVAYGLSASSESRQILLAIRLLALAVLAYIYDEHEFSQKVFGADANPSTRSQLVQQIVSLVSNNKKEPDEVSLYLQTLAMECLGVLARQRSLSNDITVALAPNSSHGLLLSLTQKGLADLRKDGDASDDDIGDDWREAIFSLLSAFMLHGLHSQRSSESVIHPSLITAYASGLGVITGKSLRVHLRILDFMKTFFHHFKDGLAVLSTNKAFEAACDLLGNLSQSALDLLHKGEGMPDGFKTKVTDYQIPYMHQQVIRSMIDLVNDIITHQGGQAERILRNLVDARSLLNAFRLILSNIDAFGAHTWSEVVKAIVGFLHNEPTSYTIISEAGIIKTLLDMVVPASKSEESTSKDLYDAPTRDPLKIPANGDAIANLSQAFGAICLTSSGFETFKASGALERFFEIFESPSHVKAIKDINTLTTLGQNFDELVRHHPSLKETIVSIVITMLARVRSICRSMSCQVGAGAKLWLDRKEGGPIVSGGIQALTTDLISNSISPNAEMKPLNLPDGRVLHFRPSTSSVDQSVVHSAKESDTHGLTVVDYARPAICFLLTWFENQTLCSSLMEHGATDIVLDFITLPATSPDDQTFGREGITHEVASLAHMMAETKPHLVLPILADRMRLICQEALHDFSTKQPSTLDCYFAPFVVGQQTGEAMDVGGHDLSPVTTNGTTTVRGLTAIYTLTTVLSEIFSMPIYNSRTSGTTTVFLQVNIADIMSDACRSLGSIAAACYREEIALQRAIPESWLSATRPGKFSTGDDDVDHVLSVRDTVDNPSSDSNRPNQTSNDVEALKRDKQTVAFKNVQTLRYLLIETPSSISDFLERFGRGIVMKRRMDPLAKHKSNMAASALADAYLAQIQPYFLPSTIEPEEQTKAKEARFAYMLISLAYVRGGLIDDSPNHGPAAARQALVIDHFRKAGGLKRLTAIGTELFDELKSCKVAQSIFSANAGLKHCLDILDDITSFQNICESCHGVWMKENNPTRPFPFNPAQLLLELRMESLSLTRKIWDSDYADQASADVVQKLVSVLKHVFNGDQESEAIQTLATYPKYSSPPKRKFMISNDSVTRIASEKKYPEDLVREAMYRSNCPGSSGTKPIEEYCDAVKDNPRRRRLFIPDGETEPIPSSNSRGQPGTPFATAAALLNNGGGEGGIEATLAEVVSSIADNDMDDMDDDHVADTTTHAQDNGLATMEISNILNSPLEPATQVQDRQQHTQPQGPLYTVENINAERESIREDLAEKCNNILNNHQNLTFELSELITSATKKLNDDDTKSYWESTCHLLINLLVSRQTEEEMTEAHGKKIAAAAHLIALLIQDNDIFKTTLKAFQDSFGDLVGFLELPAVTPQNANDSSSPWVAPILLILERMLSLDAEPAEVKWTPPNDMEPASPPKLSYNSVFNVDQKKKVFELLMNILPRVSKDKSMALSVVRILVILTRVREIAVIQGHRGNLQRLFLMIKQLGSGANGRLQNSFTLILRHIIEDDETIKQIMRSEITANFLGRTGTRAPDLTTYIRDNYHLALRAPELFVEVSNEKTKLASWSHQPGAAPLMLRDVPTEESKSQEGAGKEESKPDEDDSMNKPATSIETANDVAGDPDKSRAQEVKPPVVEHPDGLIHFLLSELLAYKDVDDKELAKININKASDVEDKQDIVGQDIQIPTTGAERTQPTPDQQDKAKFKADDHPIYLYRCFILHCLTELLYSYNRTKVEFINFSRKADPMAVTPSKPRSGILNYLLNALVSSGYVDKDDTITCKKKMVLSDWAMRVIVALCTKTGEMGLAGPIPRYSAHSQIDDQDTEPDLAFVRRFVLEHAIKAFKDATASTEPLQMKYSRLLCLSDLFRRLLTKPTVQDGAAGSHNNSYKMLGRMMFEKNLISVLTSSLAEIDLSYTSARKVIKFILRPLNDLTTLAVHLSMHSPETITSVMSNDSEDVISSASSVSDVDDGREETPDLFRNSALGMLDPNRHNGSDTSEDEDEDEEMYDEDYDDEMDYDEGIMAPNDGEVVSDEEIEEGMEDAGPLEGLPGDVPMDIEFVVNGSHDMHTDEDEDDSEDDEDDDSEDDDDENDDFEVEMDDDEDGDSNADGLHNSLGEGHEDEGEWEDEEDDDEDDDEGEDEDEDAHVDVTFEGDEIPLPVNIGGGRSNNAELNNLLRALGETDLPGLVVPPAPRLIVQDEHSDHDQDDDEEDDGDDGEDLDENEDGMDYQEGFDFVADNLEDLDAGGQWDSWGEPPPAFSRRHRHSMGMARNGVPGFMTRRVHALGDPHDFQHSARHHRHAPQSRGGGDDGTNPLLQRSESDRSPRPGMDQWPVVGSGLDPTTFPPLGTGIALPGVFSVPLPMDINVGMDNTNFASFGAHGAVLDAIVQALQRGDRDFLQTGRLTTGGVQVHINAPNEMRHMMTSVGTRPTIRQFREDPTRSASFTPSMTTSRWQEESRMLFGSTYIDKIQRVQMLILSKLVPFAQEEEKERRRKRAEEEERRKKEAAEAEKRKIEEERLKKEREEREAAERAEAEARAKAEAEAAAVAAAADAATQRAQGVVAEPMEGVQSTDGNSNEQDAALETSTTAAPTRIFTTIRGRELDITGLSVDPEYLEALPEDLREEVIMQQYTERREQAQEEGGDASAIDPDFLDALPEDIREEIRQHEAHNQRRRQREEARRQAQQVVGTVQAEDMDNDNFLATLDPALRRAILAEQPPEILSQLDPRHAAEGRAQQRGIFMNRMLDGRSPRLDDRNRREAAQKDGKRQVVQLIDKAGVATLLRLMFLPQQGSLRTTLWGVLTNVCGNRQTRFEVVSLLLVILKEGSTDVTAVERSLASLSLRAKASASQKTPQPLKKTLSMPVQTGLSEDITPMTVVQQCLAALHALGRQGFHIKTIFLREVDVSSSKTSKKGKSKESKTTKYPINDLIGLLDRRLIMDSSSCLQALAELLASVTSPLILLMKKDKDQSEEKKDETTENTQPDAQPTATTTAETAGITVTSTAGQDTAMVEAPSASQQSAATTSQGQAIDTEAQEAKADSEEASQDDKKKPFEPPVISEHNLRLVTSVFVAPECHNETFHATLETLSSLSFIPGTSVVFSKELVNHVQTISQGICGDLDDLLPLIKEAQSTSDLQGITSAKFSAGSSDQVKLLRVLQALDFLSAPKKDNDVEDESATVKSILNSSYETLSLGPLWNKLSDCLTAVREKGDTIGFANILLPLIESLMVVCKNTPLKDAPVTGQAQEAVLTTPTPEGMNDLEELFFKFTTEHRKILNDIVRQNPKLMQGNGNFSLLVKNSKVLDFDNKRNYFTKQIHSSRNSRHIAPPLQLSVRRENVFLDSFKSLYFKSSEEMKHGKLNIRFLGEEGVDAGGVTREWFQVLARGMFDANYALFSPVASDRTTFHPNPLSNINDQHLLYFKFIGRIIGKALHEGRVLDCHFSRAVYKRILGKSPNLKDLESNDVDYYKSLVWILENDITDILTEEFCVIENNFGEEKIIDLIPDGRNISVTEENKKQYVQKLVEYRLTDSVKEQLDNFLQGFHDIIPAELIAIFNEQELELLISGLPEIDVDDWKANTEYHNYSPSSPQIVWFWRIVRGMTNEERAKLLQFITGTSKVPLNGFKELEGVSGLTKHNIHKDPSTNRLPTSHTCFNQLDLPAYESFDVMKQNITTAISLGADYFGFA